MYNNRGPADVRRVFTGKDSVIFDESGIMLATIDSFQGQLSVTNAQYQPLGDAQEHAQFASYNVKLVISQCIIEDDAFIQQLISQQLQTGQMVWWTFQSVLKGRNGSEQRMIFRDCVPDGTIDLQNFSTGDVIKRQWNLHVNRPPELQSLLSYSS